MVVKLLVFTYAPAGLGHLRVTDALMDSRPKGFRYILLGSSDKLITSIHRFSSTNPIAKAIFVVSQYGILEDIVTEIYRFFLVLFHNKIYKQFVDIIKRQKDIDEIWVVATHFGLAHQIGEVKNRLMRKTGVKVRLFVQVTDDTYQHIWCVKGADLTFVPSQNTKEKLAKYSKKKGMNLEIVVAPYPICSVFTKEIESFAENRHSVFESEDKIINVSVPISGAAVGLNFISSLIKILSSKSNRFKFWVVVKVTRYTKSFRAALLKFPNVKLVTGTNDTEMINKYEELYKKTLIHLEISKPSEQAFKAILSPNLVGGVLMLFSSPVGRQEFDNVKFLKKHGLMPNKKGVLPRALRLPKTPTKAADYILWCLSTRLFSGMSSPKYRYSDHAVASGEIGPNGAAMFWKEIEERFS